jgi:hypothetical protein
MGTAEISWHNFLVAIQKQIYMPTKTTRGRTQDRSKVAGGQDYEVSYEAEKTGKSAQAVKTAVKKNGNLRTSVEKNLSGSKANQGGSKGKKQ